MKDNLVYRNFFIDKLSIFGLLISLFGAYILFPNFLNLNIYPLSLSKELWYSLDPSWVVALNYVKEKGIYWGSDFAFTYGPLGQLLTRAGWGENKFIFLFFDIFIFINYFLLFFTSFVRSKLKIVTSVIILSICLMSPLWVGSSNSLVLMTFLVFWISLSIEDNKWSYYTLQVLIIVILFYSKFNTGLIAIPLFYSGIIYNLISQKTDKTKLIITSISPILLIVLLSFSFNVDLLNYITSGFEIIKGYNDVMFLTNQLQGSYTIAVFIIFLLSIIFLVNSILINKNSLFKTGILFFLFLTSIFVLYKQAFVRADINHIKDFFVFLPLLIFTNKELHTDVKNVTLNILTLLVILFSGYYFYNNFDKNFNIKTKLNKSDYTNAFSNFTNKSGLNIYENNYPLPKEVLQKIGRNSVDIFPWNIQLLLENKLNYLPRPVIQSYTAYTPKLEELNFNHYNSKKGPEFVIFDYASIDGRYPLYDESKTHLILMKNYDVVSSFEYDSRNLLLLQRKKAFKPISFFKTKEYAMYITSPLKIEDNIYYEVSLYNSLTGKIKSTIKHAPEINIEIITQQGQIMKYKSSKLLLQSGLFSSYFINGTSDFISLNQNQINHKKIKGLYFRPLDKDMFKDKIKITEYKIAQ